MTVDTTELRRASSAVYLAADEPVAKDLSDKLKASADEIDALRRALAEVPHAELCRLLMVRDGEPCSCAKSAASAPLAPSLDPLVLIPDATTVTYLGVTRLNVHGPAGRVLGVLGVTGAHVEQRDDGRTLVVVFEQDGPST